MSDVTRLLDAAAAGDRQAAADLLPLVYDELRKLAAAHMATELPGHTLDATALVHEAYLRLASGGRETSEPWANRGHFFAAAAEAMRRILVEAARRRKAAKRGGEARRVELDEHLAVADRPDDDLLALDEALGELERHDPQAARLVKLRYFSGLTHQDAAAALGLTRRAADRIWAVARAWLYQRINSG
jgi:RNA polymerase sigma factor (TIGR02999 family)